MLSVWLLLMTIYTDTEPSRMEVGRRDTMEPFVKIGIM